MNLVVSKDYSYTQFQLQKFHYALLMIENM